MADIKKVELHHDDQIKVLREHLEGDHGIVEIPEFSLFDLQVYHWATHGWMPKVEK